MSYEIIWNVLYLALLEILLCNMKRFKSGQKTEVHYNAWVSFIISKQFIRVISVLSLVQE